MSAQLAPLLASTSLDVTLTSRTPFTTAEALLNPAATARRNSSFLILQELRLLRPFLENLTVPNSSNNIAEESEIESLCAMKIKQSVLPRCAINSGLHASPSPPPHLRRSLRKNKSESSSRESSRALPPPSEEAASLRQRRRGYSFSTVSANAEVPVGSLEYKEADGKDYESTEASRGPLRERKSHPSCLRVRSRAPMLPFVGDMKTEAS